MTRTCVLHHIRSGRSKTSNIRAVIARVRREWFQRQIIAQAQLHMDERICWFFLKPPGHLVGCGPRYRSGGAEKNMIITLEEKDIDTVLKIPIVSIHDGSQVSTKVKDVKGQFY